ncbi:hypothetical protein FQN50_005176 [Emmonsiellopsis sp. PD_5]|nr:hypothetical protein FQN50_005176 [Emmonsiellopsis sp. PD_5]
MSSNTTSPAPATLPFSIVDVFTRTPYKGNPLAVVNDLSGTLSTTQMQLITRQFNLSETTFVNPPTLANAAYRLRSFLPDGKEIYGAGHNSLGALWWLAKHGHLDSIESKDGEVTFNQEMGANATPVAVTKGEDDELAVTLRQVPPKVHGVHSNPASLAQTLGIDVADIGFEFGGKTIKDAQVASTSQTHHLFVPVASEAVLNGISMKDREKLLAEILSVDSRGYGIYLFTPSPIQNLKAGASSFQARFFSPGMSGEDPATGSAAGPLAAYLYHAGVLPVAPSEKAQISVLQGLCVGRACLITVGVELAEDGAAGGIDVGISGGGVEVMTGEVVVPGQDVEF